MFKLTLVNVTRGLLIAVIMFNALTSSLALAQTPPDDLSAISNPAQEINRESSASLEFEPSSDVASKIGKGQEQANAGSGTSTVFIENVGQFDPRARFQSHGNGMTIYFSEDAIWFTLLEPRKVDPNDVHPKVTSRDLPRETRGTRRGVNLRVNLIGSNPHPGIESFNESDTSFSYFSGNDQSAWHTNVPIWGGIRYVDIYPGMDLEITSEGNLLVWEFLVTDPSRFYNENNLVSKQGIRIKIAGHQRIQVQQNGIGVITEVGTLVMPVIRLNGMELIPQVDNNGEIVIPVPTQTSAPIDVMKFVNYVLSKETRQGEFDSTQSHIDDRPSLAPENLLLYSTFLGGNVGDFGAGLAVDQDQMVYVSGKTRSSDFPEAPGPVNGSHDMGFVAKIDMLNNQLAYVAFLGGNDYSTEPAAIAVDGNGNAYVTGYTTSDSFPTTSGVLDSDWDGDSFITKLNASGNGLIYSTFLGGSRSFASIEDADARSIEVDNNGFAYIAGYTVDEAFASTNVGYDQSHNGGWDVFVTKINPTATQQVYFTYIGGGGSEFLSDLALDGAGAIYITGYTDSNNFPTTPTSYDPNYAAATDAFVVKLDPTGTTRVYSTFLGGVGSDYSSGIALNSAGSAFVVLATADFPITSTIAPDNNPNSDGLIVKLDPSGSNLLFSAHISDDSAFLGGIAVDSSGYAYVIGSSITHGEQTSPGAYDQVGSKDDVDCQGPSYPYKCFDVFIQRLHPSGESLVYGSYFGGSNAELGAKVVADNMGNIVFLVSNTISDDFPTTAPNAIDDSLGIGPDGSGDAAVVKMDTNIPLYDCSGTTLSNIGHAVLAQVSQEGQQNYCLNKFEKFTFIEDNVTGRAAFQEFAELVSQANYEVDITTMIWEDIAGEIILEGIKDLFEKVRFNPDNYPSGIRVRILLGAEHYLLPDQRRVVLQSLHDMGIPLEPSDLPWKIEVASYRNSHLAPLDYEPPNIHSHVKILIVDGNTAIASGYNVQTLYLLSVS